MKVNSATSQNNVEQPKKLTEEEVKAKVAAKFGDAVDLSPKKKEKDVAQISASAQAKASSDTKIIDKEEVVIGDIGRNDPKDDMTQEKLKGLLRSGGFKFSDKERETLSSILKP